MSVRRSALKHLKPIAAGAAGQVYEVQHFVLPGVSGPLAFKEILSTFSPGDYRRVANAMAWSVAFRDGLNGWARAELDRYAAWPVETVEERGKLSGILMPLLSPDFFVSTTSGRKVFDLSWLSAKESQARAQGIDRTPLQDPLIRVVLLAQLVYVVMLLHGHSAVYGDISLKNVALALDPTRVMLLDCDAVASLHDPHRAQLHSPFFHPPELQNNSNGLQDEKTDVYKLGLCIIRGLQFGEGVTQAKDPAGLKGILDAEGVELVRRAVGADRDQRPSARDLFNYLERTILVRAMPPQLISASLDRTMIVRGSNVQVMWTATGATSVRIVGPDGLDVPVARSDPPTTSAAVWPRISGPIEVVVENRHGMVRAVAGIVDVYELPAFKVDQQILPRPQVPVLEAFVVPHVLSALPARPAVDSATHPVPQVEFPSMIGALEAVRPATEVVPRLPLISDSLIGVTKDIGMAMRRSLDTVDLQLSIAMAESTASARGKIDATLGGLRKQLLEQAKAVVGNSTGPTP